MLVIEQKPGIEEEKELKPYIETLIFGIIGFIVL
jgi:hypothetical protein